MALQLYNTRSRKIEPFQAMQPGRARVYVCGMTPSFHPHLGHARTFITFDVLVRYLRAKGFDVTYVRNITDIDDRIIDRAKLDGVSSDSVVNRYLSEFEDCALKLGLLEPDLSPRATREMPCIIEFIQRLDEMDVTYETSDGVYFSVERFADYGQLSRRKIEELRAGERIAVREEKRDPLDFALWKKAKPGEPTWESPWGAGRPGWHIECSAMCRHYLGDQFDIHGGALDLVFPHHENEVAQTETATHKKPMARFWAHAGLLQVDNQKMSKSLGNFIPLKDFLAAYPPAAIRYLFFQTGYRKPSNFTTAALQAAAKGLRGLYEDLDALRSAAGACSRLQAAPTNALAAGVTAGLDTTAANAMAAPDSAPNVQAAEFDAFMDDDLNTSGALGWLQKFVREQRERSSSTAEQRETRDVARLRYAHDEAEPSVRSVYPEAELSAREADPLAGALAVIDRCLGVLGLPLSATAAGFAPSQRQHLSAQQRVALRALIADSAAAGDGAGDDSVLINRVIELRNQARAAKDFAASDRLREALANAGVTVRDLKSGSEWSFDGGA